MPDNALTLAQPRTATLQADVRSLVSEWQETLARQVRAGDLAETTLRAYQIGLEKFLLWSERRSIVSDDVILEWLTDLREAGAKPSSINTWLAGVRSFFRWAFHNGRIAYNPANGVHCAKRRGTSRKHSRDILTDREVCRLLEAPDPATPEGKRDLAIISLMVYTAARQSDLERADLADLRTKANRLVLFVRGKGHIEADEILVIVSPEAENAVRNWLGVRGNKPGPLFTSLSNRTRGERLSLRAIRWIVKSYYAEAGVRGEGKTTHSLRHTAISNAVRHGAPIQKVQSMARHESVQTTMIYFHEADRLEDPAEARIRYGTKTG